MDVTLGLWRKLSSEELMLLNCGVGLRQDFESPWTERSNQSILKKISPEYSLEGLMLKLKLANTLASDVKNWLIGKDPDAGKDWRQEGTGTTEDEMVGWHYWLDGHESEQSLGVGDGQGSLACCSLWGCKELDTTKRLNWTENAVYKHFCCLHNNCLLFAIYWHLEYV